MYFEQQVVQDYMVKTDMERNKEDPVTAATVSTLSFKLSDKLEHMQVKCRATVFIAYDEFSTIMVQTLPRRPAGPDTLLHSGKFPSTSSRRNQSNQTC